MNKHYESVIDILGCYGFMIRVIETFETKDSLNALRFCSNLVLTSGHSLFTGYCNQFRICINREYFMESADVRYLFLCQKSNEWAKKGGDFWYKNNERVNTVRSTLHVVSCLLYRYWDIHHFGCLFVLNLSKMLKFAATHHEILNNENEVSTF